MDPFLKKTYTQDTHFNPQFDTYIDPLIPSMEEAEDESLFEYLQC